MDVHSRDHYYCVLVDHTDGQSYTSNHWVPVLPKVTFTSSVTTIQRGKAFVGTCEIAQYETAGKEYSVTFYKMQTGVLGSYLVRCK